MSLYYTVPQSHYDEQEEIERQTKEFLEAKGVIEHPKRRTVADLKGTFEPGSFGAIGLKRGRPKGKRNNRSHEDLFND